MKTLNTIRKLVFVDRVLTRINRLIDYELDEQLAEIDDMSEEDATRCKLILYDGLMEWIGEMKKKRNVSS